MTTNSILPGLLLQSTSGSDPTTGPRDHPGKRGRGPLPERESPPSLSPVRAGDLLEGGAPTLADETSAPSAALAMPDAPADSAPSRDILDDLVEVVPEGDTLASSHHTDGYGAYVDADLFSASDNPILSVGDPLHQPTVQTLTGNAASKQAQRGRAAHIDGSTRPAPLSPLLSVNGMLVQPLATGRAHDGVRATGRASELPPGVTEQAASRPELARTAAQPSTVYGRHDDGEDVTDQGPGIATDPARPTIGPDTGDLPSYSSRQVMENAQVHDRPHQAATLVWRNNRSLVTKTSLASDASNRLTLPLAPLPGSATPTTAVGLKNSATRAELLAAMDYPKVTTTRRVLRRNLSDAQGRDAGREAGMPVAGLPERAGLVAQSSVGPASDASQGQAVTAGTGAGTLVLRTVATDADVAEGAMPRNSELGGRADRALYLAMVAATATDLLRSPKATSSDLLPKIPPASRSECQRRCGMDGFCDPSSLLGCGGEHCGRFLLNV
ncbi:MAG: hypothetical protein H7315_13160 [Herminiimonas sp.]|nr:hypothetical protein [Herminiimonas sp.]